MSRSAKALTLSRLEDLTLGSFAFVPSSETVNHLVRYLSTWSGSEFSLFMIMQYAIKLIVPYLHLRARLQFRAGLRKASVSPTADGLTKFGNVVGDARMLFRIWGLLPIIQWMTSIERHHPPTRQLLTIERLQGWSMIAYYPLEHLYYLISHSVLPSELPSVPLASRLPFTKTTLGGRGVSWDLNALGIWSVRFWAVYVLLQFVHLREDTKVLKMRQRALNKSKAVTTEAEKEDLKERWAALRNEVVVNLGYLPLTIHWSLEKGLFKNDIWVGVFGLIAGIASWRSGWKASALPPAAAPAPDREAAPTAAPTLDEEIVAPFTLTAGTEE
ncbi:hypothetical protein B0H21DRAFT_46745 [Amylocystis lapponica]|nr:hypothetical protein B0H21DRAFT_46745 [Amylocystis lapponica]